jgi:hypothetical protein
MVGWVKLYRETQNNIVWQSTTPEQKVIFVTLLMMVNFEANSWEWEGRKFNLQPGQTITSLQNIAKAAGKGITIQKVRTALKKFESWRILTDQSTGTGRLISLLNWDKYQLGAEMLTEHLTDEQQTSNRRLTPIKEVKKLRSKEIGTGILPLEKPNLSFWEYEKQNPVDDDTAIAIKYYLERYKYLTGKEHMHLKADTWDDVIETILTAIDDTIDLEQYELMVNHYFTKQYNSGDCNYCITHFNDNGIKEVNFYEAAYNKYK